MKTESKINRKAFIKQGALLGAGALISPSLFALGRKKTVTFPLTILHTNDIHSRLEAFPENDVRNANKGGLIHLAAQVKKIREQEKAVLLLDAGDIFQGTPYFNYFGGEPEYKLMSEMGYDASVLGNHDFDNGIEGLVKVLPHKNFPIINCNYDFWETDLFGKIETQPLIKEIEYEGLVFKIGIIGLGIELKGLVSKKHYGNVSYFDPISVANYHASKLKKEHKCDLVIALSHLGFNYNTDKVSDNVLASKSKNIDIIIGGHTHTFLQKPITVNNLDQKPVVINQAGWAALKLGRIDVKLTKPF